MSDYWEKRTLANELKSQEIADNFDAVYKEYCDDALKTICRKIDALYSEIIDNNGNIKDVTRTQLYQFKHYSSLLKLVNSEFSGLAEQQTSLMTEALIQVCEATVNSIDTAMGITGSTATPIDARAIIDKNWSGEHYSDRIWNNTTVLANNMQGYMTDMLVLGQPPVEIKKRVVSDFNVSYAQADRLIRTESNYVLNSASKARYSEYTDKMEILTAEDEKVCSECRKYIGNRYELDKAPILPIHPRCRCCYIPVIEMDE